MDMKITAGITAAVLVLGLGLVGCGMVGGGKTVVKYNGQGATPIETRAAAGGTYALYSSTDYNPQVTIALQEGDTVGFRKNDTGQLFAVAGNREIPLTADKTYYWKRE
jgi:hypothetical protein